jgi:hypothetical protein
MAISQISFQDFQKLLKQSSSVLELGNQTFVNECISKFQEELKGFNNRTPVKKFVESFSKTHVSVDITGLDGSLPFDLNKEELPNIGTFDLVTNFGTTEHIEPNQYEPFLHIHNFCKINGLMVHEVPAVGGWTGHCKFYYDEKFFIELAKENNYKIIEIKRNHYSNDGDLIFCVLQKNGEAFNSSKKQLESRIHISKVAVNIPEYWKK